MSTSGITYELALALKNAGFPHKHNDSCGNFETGTFSCVSLSELISACNENEITKVLTFVVMGDYKKVGYTVGNEQTVFEGESYEECLSKIWLTTH